MPTARLRAWGRGRAEVAERGSVEDAAALGGGPRRPRHEQVHDVGEAAVRVHCAGGVGVDQGDKGVHELLPRASWVRGPGWLSCRAQRSGMKLNQNPPNLNNLLFGFFGHSCQTGVAACCGQVSSYRVKKW